ncbi:hypothetical protein ACIRNY_09365 [Capnocytophaga canimorsus]|uniref:hypothetical protein n=1 Tax=Capnocytophaga canimorsus TaxID=28188 RepID=UPI00384CB59A
MIKITIFTKGGGTDINSLFIKHSRGVAKSLKQIGETLTITPNVQIHFEVRVDGENLTFKDPVGCSHLKFFKKRGIIANSIAIKHEQLALSVENLIAFFNENILLGLSQMLDRLLKEKYELDKEHILSIVKKAIDDISEEYGYLLTERGHSHCPPTDGNEQCV